MFRFSAPLSLALALVCVLVAVPVVQAGQSAAPAQSAPSYPPLIISADGKPKAAAHRVRLDRDTVELVLQVRAPGKTVEAVRIDNLDGVSSLWRSDGKDTAAPLAVSQEGKSLSSGSQIMNVTAGDTEVLLSLSFKDNGAFAGGKTEFRVTVFFADGGRVMCALGSGDAQSATPASASDQAGRQSPDLAALQKAVEQGDAEAQTNLGRMYAEGHGVPKDDSKAVEWFEKAARQGNARAQTNLGVMFATGRGVAQDDSKAVEWYRKAADQGYARAQSQLGFMYYQGRGVAQDDSKALEWYRKAADQGDETARLGLDVMKLESRVTKSEAVRPAPAQTTQPDAQRRQADLQAQQKAQPQRQQEAQRRQAEPQAQQEADNVKTQEAGPSPKTFDVPKEAASSVTPKARDIPDMIERATVFVVAMSSQDTLHLGTGFFAAPGIVLTNRHVVGESGAKVVVLNKALGRIVPAQVVAISKKANRDYALLRLSKIPSGYPSHLAFSNDIKRTDRVGAWGFPNAVIQTDPMFAAMLRGDTGSAPEVVYSEGVISTIQRHNPPLIVHTAVLSQGNSGGPLVNTEGRVLGINTAIYLDNQTYRQSGVALSASDIIKFMREHGITPEVR